MSSVNSIASEKLVRLIGTPKCPALVDVRADDDFSADPRLVPGSVRRSPDTTAEWAAEFRGRSAVVICHEGLKLSHGVAALLREAGASAEIFWKTGLRDGREASCRSCRYGRYDVKRLIAVPGADAKLPGLLATLANCEKARSVSIHDRCKAKYEGPSVHG